MLHKRFLDGYTPAGWHSLWQTLEGCRVYDLQDDWGIGEPLLRQLQETALGRGHRVYGCYSPLEPTRLRHLLIPAQNLAFVTSDSRARYPGKPWRRLRLEAYLGAPAHKPLRQQAKALRAQTADLEQAAVHHLDMARRLHDQLEALYRPHLDLPAQAALLQNLLTQI